MARQLLGSRLVRMARGRRLEGIVTETEAYIGEKDLGCHASVGRTSRNDPMYGQAGRAYVYFTYGNHWMLNVVCGNAEFPAAVLIRAIVPTVGVSTILRRRMGRDCLGPGKLTQGLGITAGQNRADMTARRDGLFFEKGIFVSARFVTRGPRVGLYTVPEPWKSKPWRFLIKDAARVLGVGLTGETDH